MSPWLLVCLQVLSICSICIQTSSFLSMWPHQIKCSFGIPKFNLKCNCEKPLQPNWYFAAPNSLWNATSKTFAALLVFSAWIYFLPLVEIGQEGMFKGLNHTQDTLKICCAGRRIWNRLKNFNLGARETIYFFAKGARRRNLQFPHDCLKSIAFRYFFEDAL